MMAVARAGLFYFAIVFAAGLLLGPVRVMWLEPWLGQMIAVLCEAPFLIATMWFAARWAPRWAQVEGGWTGYLAIGLIALVVQQVADLAAGFGLRGMALREQLTYFTTPPGFVYAIALMIFAFMPLVRMPRAREENSSTQP